MHVRFHDVPIVCAYKSSLSTEQSSKTFIASMTKWARSITEPHKTKLPLYLDMRGELVAILCNNHVVYSDYPYEVYSLDRLYIELTLAKECILNGTLDELCLKTPGFKIPKAIQSLMMAMEGAILTETKTLSPDEFLVQAEILSVGTLKTQTCECDYHKFGPCRINHITMRERDGIIKLGIPAPKIVCFCGKILYGMYDKAR